MQTKQLVLSAVIACGFVGSFFAGRQSVGSSPDAAPIPPATQTDAHDDREEAARNSFTFVSSSINTMDILVAKRDLPVGTVLEEKDLDDLVTKVKHLKTSIPSDAIDNLDQLKGKRMNRTLKTGNFFSISDVGEGIKIPEGMLKYAIRIDRPFAFAGGFIQPGAKVDVLLTESLPDGKGKSEIIVRNVLVLAVDSVARPAEGEKRDGPAANSITLMVTLADARNLSSAAKRGELNLVLRDPDGKD